MTFDRKIAWILSHLTMRWRSLWYPKIKDPELWEINRLLHEIRYLGKFRLGWKDKED